jgi:molecular chaperone GrpE
VTGDAERAGAGGGPAPAAAGHDEERPADAGELEARLAATEDRLLRALADLDNQRKRMAKDLERERLESHRRLLQGWLEVADSAERATAAFADRRDDPLAAGLAALDEQVREVLRRQGVERIGAVGEPFDPERHEAMGTMADSGVPPGRVAAVLRPGYALEGGLLRPAQVLVADGTGGA